MDIKVIVDDATRLVCGLSEETTVQDVIVALANSLNTTGRFYLIERVAAHDTNDRRQKRASFKAQRSTKHTSRDSNYPSLQTNRYASEPRIMAPHEKPVEILSLQNKLLASNEFIEFHLFKSKYLALENDQYSEKLIEKELIEKLNTLVDRPRADGGGDFMESFHKDVVYQGQKGLKSDNYESLDNDDSNYQEYFSRSGSSLADSSMTQYSSSTTRSSDSNYYSSERTTSHQDDQAEEADVATDNEKTLRSLLSNINVQQTILEKQSLVMADLYKTIENYEIQLLELNQKKENFKVTLNNLELLNCLNSNKLSSLERETNEMDLLKEIEFNQFLCAQRDYFERRLTELSKKSDDEVNNVENLSSLVKQLNNLPDQDSRGISSKEIYSEYQMILKEIESAQKSSVLNKARLDYLQVTGTNLESCLKEKYKMIDVLEAQLKSLDLKQQQQQQESQVNVSGTSEETAEVESDEPKYDILEEYNSQSNSVTDGEADRLSATQEKAADKKCQELDDGQYSDVSMESSSSSENSSTQEAMATFLKYKRIREKSLLEKKRKSSTGAAKDSIFNEVFNTVHYF